MPSQRGILSYLTKRRCILQMGFFGNMMNNYFYGKAGKGDYTVSDMPKNRFELFGAVMRVRWGGLFGVNLLYMLFWLPGFIWTLMNASVVLSSSFELTYESIHSYLLMFLIGLVPCTVIAGPFTAGATYITRNWARDEHSFVWSDFWDAVKGNWKQALPVSLISGLMPLLLYLSWMFYGQMANQSLFYLVPMGLVFLIVMIWKLSEMVIYTMMVTYQLSLKALIRNAILMTMAKFPLAILIKLITWIVPIAAFLVMWFAPSTQMYVILILCVVYLLYVPAFNRMITSSYANALCEKYLNTKIEGAATNIGLRPDDWDDTEYIPQDDEE